MNNIINIFYDKDQPQDDNEEWGTLYIEDVKCKILSGRWGRGHAPRGTYRGYNLFIYTDPKDNNYQAMGLFNLAFQLPLEFVKAVDDATPHEKNRAISMTGIAIHPDGNIEGTKGCFGLHPDNAQHLMLIKNLIENMLIKYKSITVEVR